MYIYTYLYIPICACLFVYLWGMLCCCVVGGSVHLRVSVLVSVLVRLIMCVFVCTSTRTYVPTYHLHTDAHICTPQPHTWTYTPPQPHTYMHTHTPSSVIVTDRFPSLPQPPSPRPFSPIYFSFPRCSRLLSTFCLSLPHTFAYTYHPLAPPLPLSLLSGFTSPISGKDGSGGGTQNISLLENFISFSIFPQKYLTCVMALQHFRIFPFLFFSEFLYNLFKDKLGAISRFGCWPLTSPRVYRAQHGWAR